MKFNTTTLRKSVEAEIKRRHAEANKTFKEAQAAHDKAKAEWLASDKPQVIAAAAKRVAEKARRGRVITPEDLRDLSVERWSNSPRNFFDYPEPERSKVTGATARVETLEALRDFLAAVADDEVTSTGLREVGFRNIAQILRAAASA